MINRMSMSASSDLTLAELQEFAKMLKSYDRGSRDSSGFRITWNGDREVTFWRDSKRRLTINGLGNGLGRSEVIKIFEDNPSQVLESREV